VSAVAEPIGHDAIREMLRRLAAARVGGSQAALHHAWLFAGPAGVGKFQIARWWATLLKCPQLGACEPSCDNCLLVAGAVHPDVFETGPAPKDKNVQQTAGVEIERKKSVGVQESRDLLHRLSLRPVKPGPRVAIMREAGTMTAEAQNALLKLLEEPPGSAVIILVTDNVGATVRSRCRHLAFGALATTEVAAVLRRLGKDQSEAEAAAACSRGSVARGLAFDADGLAERETLLLAWEEVLRKPFGIDALVQTMAQRKDDGYALVDILEWQLAKIQTSLGREPTEPSEPRPLIEEAARIQQTIDALARNANAKLVIRDLLMNVRA
jgi:hypothetical protein